MARRPSRVGFGLVFSEHPHEPAEHAVVVALRLDDGDLDAAEQVPVAAHVHPEATNGPAEHGEPTVFGPVEALVGRGANQEASELLILITPHIVRRPMGTSMVHVERDVVDADLLHWILVDGAGARLTFSTPGIIETSPPQTGPR